MKKDNRLGKGLEAIFMENSILDEENTSDMVAISQIEPNREQPRKKFNEEALANLADSIAHHGVIQPLLVRPLSNGNYQIVAGERRWRAARMAGITEVPVVIKDLSDTQVLEIALIENLQREDLSPIEEAQAYKTLMESCNMTQDEVSKSVGKSRPYITNSLRLLSLPLDVVYMVDRKEISAGHARTLLGIKDEDMLLKVAKEVAEKGISVRELEKLVRKINYNSSDCEPKSKAGKKSGIHSNVFFNEVELLLHEHLGRKVNIDEDKKGKGGVIKIQFYGQEDLADIARRLGRE